MRRTTTLLLAIIFIALSCNEDENGKDTVPMLADDYRLSRILSYPNSASPSPTSGLEFSYDATTGNLIKESLIDYPNTLSVYKDYEYSANKKTRVKIYDGQVGNLTLGTYIEYFYTNDKVSREELYQGDGTLKYSTYYVYEGDKLVNTYKDGDGFGIHHQHKYSFDSKDRLILEEAYMYNQELEEFIKYFYDNRDRIIKTEWYNHAGALTVYEEKEYEGTSNFPAKELQYNASGTLTQTRLLTYDQWNNLTTTTVTGPGVSCTLFKKKYNGQLLMEQITYSPAWGCEEWTVTRYEYSKK